MYFEATNQSVTGSQKVSSKNTENSYVTDNEGSSQENEKVQPKEKKKSTFYSSQKCDQTEIEKNLIKDLTPKTDQVFLPSIKTTYLVEKEENQIFNSNEKESDNFESNINQADNDNLQIFLEKKNDQSISSQQEQIENQNESNTQVSNKKTVNNISSSPKNIENISSGI